MKGISVGRRLLLLHRSKLPIGAAASYSSFNGTRTPHTNSPISFCITTNTTRTTNHHHNNNSPASFRLFPQITRYFSSGGSSNIVMVETEEQLNSSLRKVQDESLPAIYYFTSASCPPCKLVSPIIEQLSEKYPHVTAYKVDVDKEELENGLSRLDINSVPRIHFFHNGKKDSEIVGAYVGRIKSTMEKLYS